jgi:hypothetical protein
MAMKKIFLWVTCVVILLVSVAAQASVTPPFTSTFDCNAWDQTSGISTTAVGCDGIGPGTGNWNCTTGGNEYDAITSAANYPSGGGGRGYRHWVGVQGSNGTGLNLMFTSNQTEFWFRTYVRFEDGFPFSSIDLFKMFYLHGSPGILSNIGYLCLPQYLSDDSMYYYTQSGDHDITIKCQNCGVSSIYGGNTSDGSWFEVDIHCKAENGGDNGVFQAWINGDLKIDRSDVTFGSSSFSGFIIGSNVHGSATDCWYVDFDDIALSTTGYIGPLSGGSPLPTVSVAVQDGTAGEEGPNPGAFRISRNTSSGSLDVPYTMSGTATEGTDYSSTSGTATIGDGETYVDVPITVIDDSTLSEGDETVILTIDTSANYDIVPGSGSATITISDNDGELPPPINITTTYFQSKAELEAQGWYDNTDVELVYDPTLDSNVFRARWSTQGQKTPDGGGAMRLQFTPTDRLWVQFKLKYSDNWVGNGATTNVSHHMLLFLTSEDSSPSDPYHQLARTNFTLYLEGRTNDALVYAQDGAKIDPSLSTSLTNSLLGASFGCNGDYANAGYNGSNPGGNSNTVTCYLSNGSYWNGRWWATGTAPITNSTWHDIRYVVVQNTITYDAPDQNGVLEIYVDNMTTPVLSYSNIVWTKTGSPFAQAALAPYLSSGNPLSEAQDWEMANLIIGTDQGATATPVLSKGRSTAGKGQAGPGEGEWK